MNKIVLALSLVMLILFSIIVAGSLLLDLEDDEVEEVQLYTFPISMDDKTYTVGVGSNYSVSDVRYFGILRYVSVDFRGSLRATVVCEIVVPADLIWGELFVYKKGYIQSADSYVLSNNGTHHSLQMTFKHIATVEVISIKGTEGITESPFPIPTPTLTPAPSPTPEPANLNQEYDVRITSFSVDPEGWYAPYDNDVVKCPVSVTIQNVGTDDVQGLKCIVILYHIGDVVGGEKQGVILGFGSREPSNFVLRAGEVRSFQGEMYCVMNIIGTGDGHPVGSTYVAQVKLGWGDTLDEAEWKPP